MINAAPRFKNLASEIARIERITDCKVCARRILANGRENYRDRINTIVRILDEHYYGQHAKVVS
jgi:hypothetical protein